MWQFSDVLGPGKPFGQQGTRGSASRRAGDERIARRAGAGLIASVDQDFKGMWAKAPCYLECRFTAQSAIGTWLVGVLDAVLCVGKGVGDELDIIEAYGGRERATANHPRGIRSVTHYWGQKNPDGDRPGKPQTRPAGDHGARWQILLDPLPSIRIASMWGSRKRSTISTTSKCIVIPTNSGLT